MKLLFVFSVSLSFFVPISVSEKARYDNYRVYSAKIENALKHKLFQDLIESDAYTILNHGRVFKSSIDIMVAPSKFAEFTDFLELNRIEYKILIENIQRLIDEEQPQELERAFGWKSYHGLSEIYNWLDTILKSYPNQTSPFLVGKSFEGRDIRGIKISYKSGNPGIFLECNIHAREWITSATATFIMNELLTSTEQNVRQIAENIDWYIIPVLNVDGFVYSHEKDRLWRKTRQKHNSTCVGVDANRNFDSFWMVNGGASSNPCSETYAGPKPFSEPETIALANFYNQIKDKISIYLAFHSYGQYILSPYGHTAKNFPKNYQDMQTISKATSEAIRKRYGTQYIYGSTAAALYIASGTSADWVYNTYGTPISYTLEFRDTGNYGFILPGKEIRPNALEILDGLFVLISTARELRYL